jgi:predicted aconitase with swiveling domain
VPQINSPLDPLTLDEPLSFWGGLDPHSGLIIDHNHPQRGQSIAGRVLQMPHGRGSSSSPTVLAEALRLGNGPSAIVLAEPDPMINLGALVAKLLYGVDCPVEVRPQNYLDW